MSTTLTIDKKEKLVQHLAQSKYLNHSTSKAAQAAIAELSIPGTKTEAWKYTRVGKLTGHQYENAEDSNFPTALLEKATAGITNAHTLVFWNGQYMANHSDGELEGYTVLPLQDAIAQNDATFEAHFGKYAKYSSELFTALNVGYTNGGAFIHIPANSTDVKTIHLVYLMSGSDVFAQPRNLIVADKSSEGHVIQSYYSEGAENCLHNCLSEVYVGENTNLRLDKIQFEGEIWNQTTEQVYQEGNSNFHINTMALNGRFIRNNLNIVVDGENSEANLYGLYVPNGNQHVDNHTMVDHTVPNCESNELYKGLINDKAKAVFNGKVFVRQDAQKTNAFQSNANILLSDDGTIYSKPELEIYADDVKCSHGSTTGQFDDEAVFYLRSRGLSEANARQLLVGAFATDVLEGIKSNEVRQKVKDLLYERFGWLFS